MTNTSTASSGRDCVAAYEALRTHIVTGSTASSPNGLVLFLRKGMGAWMVHRQERIVPRPAASAATQKSDGFHSSIVQVLASMALGQKEMVLE